MGMNTMNLVTTLPTQSNLTTNRTADLTTLDSTQLEAWFADAGLAVTAVTHCASADCSVCFPFNSAAIIADGPLAA